ncbi:hypothetical protein GCM10007424_25050 [Flavobacterium suaedae]|uniref:Uncharacterized protein n=1 Tax=Flavobacterium suaedae TaxID=1767027 RepID=A0ABQ1K5I9_9FLAO|nr:hypothetical protein [Flavobacterium suaedae]GGB84037.1 hypothetical protein GCM10007424_25050 [Flavobacterium suaedae]
MANEKITLASLDLDMQGLIKAAATSKTEIDKIKAALSSLKKAGLSASEGFKSLETQLTALTQVYAAQQQAIAQLEAKNKNLAKSQEDAEKSTKKLNKQLDKTAKQAKSTGKDLEKLEKSAKTAAKGIDKLEDELEDVTDELEDVKDGAKDTAKSLSTLTGVIEKNKKASESSSSATEKLKSNFKESKELFKESFDQINIFNGGLGGFITRAEEAGGTGPMVKGAFEGMSSGIMGMTNASLSFIATPIGAVIAAIALVIGLVKNAMDRSTASAQKITKIFDTFSAITDGLMQLLEPLGEFLIDGIAAGFELAGKAAEAAIGWISDGLSFLGFGDAAEDVKEFTEQVKKNAEETQNLKNAQEDLAAQSSIQEIANEKAKQQIDELNKKINDQTLTEEERIKVLKKRSKVEQDNLNQRKKNADETYNIAVRQAAQGKYLSDEELKQLQEGGVAYAEKLRKVKGFTQEEIDALKAAQLERMRLSSEEIALTRQTVDEEARIRDEARQEREQKEADAAAKAQEWRDKQKERQAEYAKQLDLELQKFMQVQSQKEMSAEEELNYLEEVKNRKIAVAKAEYEASEKTTNDKLALELEVGEITMNNAKEQADVAIENANRELANYIENHKSKITAETELTNEIIAEENKRLEGIKNKQLETLAIEKNTSDQIIEDKKARNVALSEADIEYLEQKKAIEDEYKAQTEENNKALEEQKKVQEAAKHEQELQEKLAKANTEYEKQQIIEDDRHIQEVEKLKQQKDEGLITEQEYNQLYEAETQRHEKANSEIKKAAFNNKLELAKSTYTNMATILGKESEAGKAMAIAQATIDTFKSAVSAYGSMATIPIVGPALGATAAAAAVVAGTKNVKKIAGTKAAKAPKAEKGALFDIGGKRHSQGGTTFTGEDGTRFEAEQGELIGVMNRNAAQHFMAFNNAFPAGGGSASSANYFESGGIVSRAIATPGMNTDELAAKIAEANQNLPAPRVAVEDIVTEGDSYVQVREGANF